MKIAVISAVLDEPARVQKELNEIISNFSHIVRCRNGFPMLEQGVAIITLVVTGSIDEINALTGKLGKLSNVWVKSSFSKKEI